MDAQLSVDLVRAGIWLALMIALPVLISGVTVGLLLGLFQAVTQIQEQTIAIVLKIVVMVLVGALLFPWMTIHMCEFTTDLYENIPEYVSPNSVTSK